MSYGIYYPYTQRWAIHDPSGDKYFRWSWDNPKEKATQWPTVEDAKAAGNVDSMDWNRVEILLVEPDFLMEV